MSYKIIHGQACQGICLYEHIPGSDGRSAVTVKNVVPSSMFTVPCFLKQEVFCLFRNVKVFFITGHQVGGRVTENMSANHTWIFMTIRAMLPFCIKVCNEGSRITVHGIFRPIGENVIYCLIFPITAILNIAAR